MADAKLGNVLRHIRRWATGPSTAGPTDGELLERFVAQHDEAAFGTLLQRHGRLVFNVCRRILHDAHDAEDAFQATFLVLTQRAESIRQHDSVASWLYGVAYRISVRARARAEKRCEQERQAIGMEPANPETEATWRELRPLLDAEVDRLPEKYRAPLVLCYFEGLSNEEAAQQLQWPSGTVKGRLARARDLLRERLARRGLTLSAVALAALLGEQAMASPLPAALVEGTIKATALVVAGKAAAAAVFSAEVAALAQGALQSMVVTKLKLSAALVAVVALTLGAGVFTYALAERPKDANAPNVAAAEQPAPSDAGVKEIKFETIAKANVGGPSKSEQKVFKTEKEWQEFWATMRNAGRPVFNGPVGGPKIMPLPNVVPGQPMPVPAPGALPMPPKVAPGAPAPAGGAGGFVPGAAPMPPKVAPGAPAQGGGAGGAAPGAAPMPVPVPGGNGQVAPVQLQRIAAPPQAVPKVDFDKQIVIAVSMGQGGVGRSIEITKIEQTKDGVKVYYKEQQPDPARPRPALAMLSGPFHIVKLDKPTGEIKFVKEEAKKADK